ncbi:MAG TPA: exosortase A [Allosphingosinicella sp.]|jgi:exosortase A
MTAVLPIAPARPLAAPGWRDHLAGLAALWIALLLLFRRDAAQVATIWWEGSTFNHCLLIVPLIGWLVWQRRPELRGLAPTAWAPGLLLVAAGAGGWLLGDAGSLAIARHFGLLLMLQGAAIACLGKAVARGLAFPIFYAVFLVPAGEELVPPLQTVTADLAMALLRFVGVPAHRVGVFIATPTGLFEVAAACSGVKFLIAMIAYGALAANVCFRSWLRRGLFLAACIAIPILANGARAFGTIYIAYLSNDIGFASGFDHIFYGWVFFAIVIGVVMGAAWPFFDRGAGDPWFDPRRLQPEGAAPGSSARLVRIAAAALALAAAAPLWSAATAAAGTTAVPELALPDVPGWQRVAARGRPWQPTYAGADRARIGRYRDSAGREVALAVAIFARQADGRELVGSPQGPVPEDRSWSWTADLPAPPGGRAERIFSHGTLRDVLTFYRVGGIVTGSAPEVKLETIRTRLLGGPQRAVAVVVSAEEPDARPALDAFVRALGPLDRLADRAAGLPETR